MDLVAASFKNKRSLIKRLARMELVDCLLAIIRPDHAASRGSVAVYTLRVLRVYLTRIPRTSCVIREFVRRSRIIDGVATMVVFSERASAERKRTPPVHVSSRSLGKGFDHVHHVSRDLQGEVEHNPP